MSQTKKNLKGMVAPTVFKTTRRPRQITKAVRGEIAKKAIGPLYPGCEIYGFTKGQFSMIDILEHCIREAGPSEVVICTWSAASGDIQAANRLLSNNSITTLKFIIDYSFQSRKPQFCQELIKAFGEECIRVTSIHAKFALIKSSKTNLVLRTSMNLNFNPRFENFEISDDPTLMAFMEEIVAEIWKTQDKGQGFTNRPADNKNQFKATFGRDEFGSFDLDDFVPFEID